MDENFQNNGNWLPFRTHLRANTLGANRQKLCTETINSKFLQPLEAIIRGDKDSPASRSLARSPFSIKTTFVTDWNQYDAGQAKDSTTGLFFIDGATILTRDALCEFAYAFHKGADLVYADEFVSPITQEGDIFYKPGWSPELLYTFQYIGKSFLVSTSIFTQAGGFGERTASVALHDFLLRLKDCAPCVTHIPRALLSTKSSKIFIPDDSVETTQGVIEEAIHRVGLAATVRFTGKLQPNGMPTFQVFFPDEGPSVAIMIASRNKLELLKNCLVSLKKTTYRNYKVYVVDNESDNSAMLEWLKTTSYKIISVDRPQGKFNFAHVYNTAIPQVCEEYVLLLNSDIEIISSTWLSDMVGYGQLPRVGSVGARLIFGDGSLQHCGIYHDVNHGFPGTAFRHMPSEEDGYWQLSRLSCNHMAETAACVLTPKKLYLEQGGLDEQFFGVAFNDCDYGYRLHAAGYRNVFCPTAELYHLENATRGRGDSPQEEANYIKKYSKLKEYYYSPHFIHNTWSPLCNFSSRTVETLPLMPFRLLMVMHDLTRTGACRTVCLIAIELKKRGLITPIVLSHLDGPLRPVLENFGIEVHIMPHFHMLQSKSEEHFTKYFEEMTGWIQELEPDVVHGNTILTFWAMGVAHRLGIPCCWTIHESETPFSHLDEHSPLVKPFAKQCMQYPYLVNFVADATKKLFSPYLKGGNSITVHNGFDREYFCESCSHFNREQAREKIGITDDTLYVLCVGTICERKGQHDILEALQLMDIETLSKCQFSLVGGPVETDYRRELLAELEGLSKERSKHVTVHDNPGNIDFYYKAADLFICTSRIESFPRTIQEAMCCDLPIITTPVFGIVEQVRNKVSALFYEPGDIKTLCRHIKELANDQEKRTALGSNAGIALDILPNTSDMVDSYETIFKEAWLSGTGDVS